MFHGESASRYFSFGTRIRRKSVDDIAECPRRLRPPARMSRTFSSRDGASSIIEDGAGVPPPQRSPPSPLDALERSRLPTRPYHSNDTLSTQTISGCNRIAARMDDDGSAEKIEYFKRMLGNRIRSSERALQQLLFVRSAKFGSAGDNSTDQRYLPSPSSSDPTSMRGEVSPTNNLVGRHLMKSNLVRLLIVHGGGLGMIFDVRGNEVSVKEFLPKMTPSTAREKVSTERSEVIQVGDVLLAIGGVFFGEHSFDEVVCLLRGIAADCAATVTLRFCNALCMPHSSYGHCLRHAATADNGGDDNDVRRVDLHQGVLLWGTAYRVLGQDGITEGSRRHEIPSVDLSLPLAFGWTIAEATGKGALRQLVATREAKRELVAGERSVLDDRPDRREGASDEEGRRGHSNAHYIESRKRVPAFVVQQRQQRVRRQPQRPAVNSHRTRPCAVDQTNVFPFPGDLGMQQDLEELERRLRAIKVDVAHQTSLRVHGEPRACCLAHTTANESPYFDRCGRRR